MHSRMANVTTNLHHHSGQMNGIRSSAGGDTVLVQHHTTGDNNAAVHHQTVVTDSKNGILQQQQATATIANSVTEIDGNFIHDILGMNSQIEIIDEDVQQQHHGNMHHQQQHHVLQQAQQHQEVVVHQDQSQQQVHILNATPEQILELQAQGAYTQENGNRVIVVSEMLKCDICNLGFLFKDHYIQHCDDHIRMVAEHINLKGIVPINNFEEANEVLDFRTDDGTVQQTIGPDGTIVNGVGHLQEQQQQIIVQHNSHQQQQGNETTEDQHVIQQHQVIQEILDNGHGVVNIGSVDSSMIEDIDEGDPQLSGSSRSGGSKSSKRTSQQQLQAQLNSEWCKCLPCDFKFRTPLSLSRHLNAHMENRNRCEKCNKFFTSYVSLNTHQRQCRGDEEGAIVMVANQGGGGSSTSSIEEGAAGSNGRARSTSIDGPVSSPGHPNKVYKCKKCNVQFHSANQYRDHKLTHSNDVYTCNECHKAFLSIINLNRHRQNEHQHRQTFMCAICNCEFTNVGFLEEHNKTRSHLHNLSNSSRDPYQQQQQQQPQQGNSSGGGGRGRQSGGRGRGADVVVID